MMRSRSSSSGGPSTGRHGRRRPDARLADAGRPAAMIHVPRVRRPADPELRAGHPLRDPQRGGSAPSGCARTGATRSSRRSVQHVELAAIAVAVGFVLATALAFAGFRFRLLDPPIGFFADFLYTIPAAWRSSSCSSRSPA